MLAPKGRSEPGRWEGVTGVSRRAPPASRREGCGGQLPTPACPLPPLLTCCLGRWSPRSVPGALLGPMALARKGVLLAHTSCCSGDPGPPVFFPHLRRGACWLCPIWAFIVKGEPGRSGCTLGRTGRSICIWELRGWGFTSVKVREQVGGHGGRQSPEPTVPTPTGRVRADRAGAACGEAGSGHPS